MKVSEDAQLSASLLARNLASKNFLESTADFFDAVAGDAPSRENFIRAAARMAGAWGARTAKNVTDPIKT